MTELTAEVEVNVKTTLMESFLVLNYRLAVRPSDFTKNVSFLCDHALNLPGFKMQF